MFSKPSLFQKRISLSQITKPFSESPLDLLNPILSPSNETDSVLELSSEKSGLRLTFSTNRTSSFRSASWTTHLGGLESGVQFYTNNYASAANGARKKIHGGSGKVGDGYSPSCEYFLWLFTFELSVRVIDTRLQPPHSSNSMNRPLRSCFRPCRGMAMTHCSLPTKCIITLSKWMLPFDKTKWTDNLTKRCRQKDAPSHAGRKCMSKICIYE